VNKLKAYKFRLYPNKTQEILINKTIGCVRFFWNNQVATFNSYNKETNPSVKFKTSTEVRNEFNWMKEVSAAVIQQKEIDFKEFKKQRFSVNRKKSIGNPKFKKKGNQESFRLPNQKFNVLDNKIQLEKIGKVKMVMDRVIPEGKFMSVTVSKNPSGQFYASILIETEINYLPKKGKSVGIDVGLKEFIVTSDNDIVKNPKYFRESQSKLRTLQKHFARKQKGSKRRQKLKLKIAKIHQKITNQRDYFLHNESIKLVRNYDVIVIEDLNVSGMVKNRKLAKSISDASFSKFFSMLKYKSEWCGKELVQIGRFEPTSKTCSCCGWVKKDLTLKDRVFICENCGIVIDRDYNASLNIHSVGVNAELNRAWRDSKSNLLVNPDEVLKNKNENFIINH
jgi:putative transposase